MPSPSPDWPRSLPPRSLGACLGAFLALLASAPLRGQRPAERPAADSVRPPLDAAALDSLRARLARAEAAIALLRTQLGDESESAVHSRSRVRVELSGQVVTNAFLTDGRANVVDVPQSVLAPPLPTAPPQTSTGALGLTLRQTRLGVGVTVTEVLGGSFNGDVELDFFGGQQTAPGDRRLFPEPRLRTASARVAWRHTELFFGQETPLISDQTPVSLAAVGIPNFSGAGNLWNWLAQVRLTQQLARTGAAGREVRWALTGAVMSPFAGSVYPGEQDAVDAGERSRRPALEARLGARWGGEDGAETIVGGQIGDRGGEIGIGAHLGWIEVVDDRIEQSRAVSVDARAVLARGIELRGEGYAGRMLRGLGGGGIGQNFGNVPPGSPAGSVGAPLRDVAGWAQVNVQPHALVLAGIGCGIDLANADDAPTRLQNTSCAAHAQWRPAQPLVLALEYRQIGTRYARGTFGVKHVNLAIGFEY